MVKTHLPQHMDSVREKWRPKHQLLILKCYPRLPKNSSADVSPNGSELSYLLYYASTRQSKLQKVGAFLERKTSSDVYHWQSARVVVTLQILTALLEHKAIGSGSAFGLIAPYVLRIIHCILSETNDVSLVEACLTVWEIFCQHQDQASLVADSEYRSLYEQVVKQWAMFAQKTPKKVLSKGNTVVSIPDAIRLRKTGLYAIKAILTSDTLSFEVGRQLNHGVPAILTNIHGDDAFSFNHLLALSKRFEDDEKEKDRMNRRQSMATVRTHTGNESTMSDPRAAAGTAQDADELAEEETAVLAVECLKNVFETDNRSQIRIATSQVLAFLAKEQQSTRGTKAEQPATAVDWTSWSAKLFETVTSWTPVQDRFIVIVTATETLVRLPLSEEFVSQHLLITQLIDDIFRSDLNLIGLSVMDVLLGFVQQILRVLQLGSTSGVNRGGTASSDDIRRVATNNTSNTANTANTMTTEKARKYSTLTTQSRFILLARLKSCIADLATHIYYTDQITDMVAAILLRLKPNVSPTSPSNPVATAAAIQEPSSAVTDSASQISLARERSQNLPGGFFSFDAARQIALESVKEIIIVANSAGTRTPGSVAENRNLVSLSVWEGTQWLLRDPAPNVRRAYVDAICTWLQHETHKTDARIQEEKPTKLAKNGNGDGYISRRAHSSASDKERQFTKSRNAFLQLLHLAVYENALQHAATSEADILLLHLLLTSMSPKLGVNAVQSALPMIITLQEEIARVNSVTAKIRIGSLVHGYFWQLAEQFELATDMVGREIFSEIARRKHHGIWMHALSVPSFPLERIPLAGDGSSSIPPVTTDALHQESLRPFDHRQALVDKIAQRYATINTTPTPSTPSSPNRHGSASLERSVSSYLSIKATSTSSLPDRVKEAMMAVWTKEQCLASIAAAAASKTASVTGSHSSPSAQVPLGNHRQLLAGMNQGTIPSDKAGLSPAHGQAQSNTQYGYGVNARGLYPYDSERRPSGSVKGGGRYESSVDGPRTQLKVDELKQVLTGGSHPMALVGHVDADDSGSESMVDVRGEDFGSEADFRAPSERGPGGYMSQIMLGSVAPRHGKAPVINDTYYNGHSRGNGSISGRASVLSYGRSGAKGRAGHGRQDLAALLDGIELGDQNAGKKVGMVRPPY